VKSIHFQPRYIYFALFSSTLFFSAILYNTLPTKNVLSTLPDPLRTPAYSISPHRTQPYPTVMQPYSILLYPPLLCGAPHYLHQYYIHGLYLLISFKVLEKSLRVLFETRDLSLIKKFVQRQCTKLMEGRASLQDFTFAKEYRGMKNYKPGACVPALELTR